MSLCDIEKLIKQNLKDHTHLIKVQRGSLLGGWLTNSKGYIASIEEKGKFFLLFIADEEDSLILHGALSSFVGNKFKDHCMYVKVNEVRLEVEEGLLI